MEEYKSWIQKEYKSCFTVNWPNYFRLIMLLWPCRQIPKHGKKSHGPTKFEHLMALKKLPPVNSFDIKKIWKSVSKLLIF